jgi:hypothetical protein
MVVLQMNNSLGAIVILLNLLYVTKVYMTVTQVSSVG